MAVYWHNNYNRHPKLVQLLCKRQKIVQNKTNIVFVQIFDQSYVRHSYRTGNLPTKVLFIGQFTRQNFRA